MLMEISSWRCSPWILIRELVYKSQGSPILCCHNHIESLWRKQTIGTSTPGFYLELCSSIGLRRNDPILASLTQLPTCRWVITGYINLLVWQLLFPTSTTAGFNCFAMCHRHTVKPLLHKVKVLLCVTHGKGLMAINGRQNHVCRGFFFLAYGKDLPCPFLAHSK